MDDHAIKIDELTLGVCYYPVHWDESLWATDLERMQGSGIAVIRIAEFAWNKFEPEEGYFMALVSHTELRSCVMQAVLRCQAIVPDMI